MDKNNFACHGAQVGYDMNNKLVVNNRTLYQWSDMSKEAHLY